MARLHSRKKGKAGTKRSKKNLNPEWVTASKPQIKELVVKMAKEGVTASKIGLYLRDQKGVPDVRAFLGHSLVAFLKKENAAPQYPEDLMNLIRKAVRMNSHLKASKKDVISKVKLVHVESKIGRLVKYYLSKGALPKGWKYDREQVALLVK